MTPRTGRAEALEDSAVLVVAPSRRIVGAGGAWLAIAEWAEALKHQFGSVEIVTADEELDIASCRAEAFGSTRGSGRAGRAPQWRRELSTLRKDAQRLAVGLRFRLEVRRLDLSARADGVVFQYHTLFQWAGFELARRTHRPLVLFVDAPNVWEARQWGVRRPLWGWILERWTERPTLRRADVVVCISDEVRDVLESMGVVRDRIVVAGNTVDVRRFEQETRSARRALGLEGKTVIGWIGGFQPFHKVDLLIEAYAPLEREREDVALLLVGDGPYRSHAESIAHERGLERVVFTGAVPWEDVPQYLNAMDIGVIPAGDGPFHYSPIKLREYTAAGLPVVVPDLGEPARLLRNDESGLLYRAGDPEKMAVQLRRLLASEELRSQLAAAAAAQLKPGGAVRDIMDHLIRERRLSEPTAG